ncbi:hypothetical protein [Actinosynnema mirum]
MERDADERSPRARDPSTTRAPASAGPPATRDAAEPDHTPSREATMPATTNSELDRALGELRRCISTLRSHHGDNVTIRRLANGVERLEIDAAELPARGRPVAGEVVYVPDTPYDPALWRDVDDEGIGGHRRGDR